MFSHIPGDVFCTQINGNVDAALKVLDTRLGSLKNRARTFDWEFSLDPDNPVTQVSKTPSDEEFPCNFKDGAAEKDDLSPPTSPRKTRNELDIVAESDEHLHVSVKEDDPKSEEDEMEGSAKEVTDTESRQRKWRRAKPSLSSTSLLLNDVIQFIEEFKNKIAEEATEARVIPCYSACRFELPIDKTRLERVSPLEYIVQYACIAETRRTFYGVQYEIYTKTKDITHISPTDIQDLHKKLYREPVTERETVQLSKLLDLKTALQLDREVFTAVSCLMERVIIHSKSLNSDKNPFEVADFCALNAKLHRANISQLLRSLLEFIRTA